MFYRIPLLICSLALVLMPFATSAATISPSVLELEGSRGSVIESTFALFNTNTSDQTYFLDVISFEAADETGTPAFFEKTSEENEFLGWISFPVKQVRVPAQTKVDVPFNIVIPDDVASGGKYAAITVSTTPTDVVTDNGVVIEAKTAVLVLLTVSGATVESLQLLDFSFEQKNVDLPFGEFQYRLQNQGNVHVKPEGTVQIVGAFGQEIAYIDANEVEGRILPRSTRQYAGSFNAEMNWFEKAAYQLRYLVMGPIKAELSLSYGSMNEALSAEVWFWVLPWELLSLILLIVLSLFSLYRIMRKN